jgi:hypothetical protein
MGERSAADARQEIRERRCSSISAASRDRFVDRHPMTSVIGDRGHAFHNVEIHADEATDALASGRQPFALRDAGCDKFGRFGVWAHKHSSRMVDDDIRMLSDTLCQGCLQRTALLKQSLDADQTDTTIHTPTDVGRDCAHVAGGPVGVCRAHPCANGDPDGDPDTWTYSNANTRYGTVGNCVRRYRD